jgi:uncharacterized cupredoxin-like copper-binding protein
MRPKQWFVVFFVMALALAGCAGGGRVESTVRSGRLAVLPIQAGYLYFWPNAIRVDKPGPLAVTIKNVSDGPQNFTLKAPRWHTVESVDLPAGETTTINVEFSTPGVYQFYCNRTMRSLLGMNGQISVGE